MQEKITVLEKEELIFLLSCKGCLFFAGPLSMPQKIKNGRKVMEGLYQKGWLENDGSYFKVSRGLSGLIGQLAAANHAVHLVVPGKNLPDACLYPGEKVLILRETAVRRECVSLWQVEKDRLILFMEEEGYLEENIWNGREPWQKKIEVPGEGKVETDGFHVRLFMERMDTRSGERDERICIVSRAGSQFIRYREQEQDMESIYSPDKMQEQWEAKKWF